MTLESKWLVACALLVPACVETKLIGETTPGESSSTTGGPASTETTTAPATSESASSEGTGSSSTSQDASSDSTTHDDVMGEWVGAYDSGFSNRFITPCGETDAVLIVDGPEIPGYEYCQHDTEASPIWIRIRGTRIDGERGPEIHGVELLEGPCLVGGCERDAVFDECTDDFDAICVPPVPNCDPVAQDCAKGAKCSLVEQEVLFDCIADGTLAEGEACERVDGLDECRGGLLCAADELGGDGPGTCARYCATDDQCLVPDTTCMLGVDLGGYGVCVPT
jgi:hypothetical protein